MRPKHQMRPRDPNAEGVWAGDGVAFGHRHLSIIDLDGRAVQLMKSTDGRFVIVFNGEIYDLCELCRALQPEGMAFRTTAAPPGTP